MQDETPTRPAETPDGGGHRRAGGSSDSPLQARAAFLAKWSWDLGVGINGRVCARGGAQHGFNSEAGAACGEDWERQRASEVTLGEALDFLRGCHRSAPSLFFNGNTFADIGRRRCDAAESHSAQIVPRTNSSPSPSPSRHHWSEQDTGFPCNGPKSLLASDRCVRVKPRGETGFGYENYPLVIVVRSKPAVFESSKLMHSTSMPHDARPNRSNLVRV